MPSIPAEHNIELSAFVSLGSDDILLVKLAFPTADQSNDVTLL